MEIPDCQGVLLKDCPYLTTSGTPNLWPQPILEVPHDIETTRWSKKQPVESSHVPPHLIHTVLHLFPFTFSLISLNLRVACLEGALRQVIKILSGGSQVLCGAWLCRDPPCDAAVETHRNISSGCALEYVAVQSLLSFK